MAPRRKKSSGPRKTRKVPKVEVSWVDATGHSGWQSVDDALSHVPVLMHTLGYLIDRNQKFIKLVRSVEDKGNDVGDTFTIPTDWVQRIRKLK